MCETQHQFNTDRGEERQMYYGNPHTEVQPVDRQEYCPGCCENIDSSVQEECPFCGYEFKVQRVLYDLPDEAHLADQDWTTPGFFYR